MFDIELVQRCIVRYYPAKYVKGISMGYEHNLSPRIFKQCPLCGKIWNTRDSFLNDKSLHLNGYQLNQHINDTVVRKLMSMLSHGSNENKGKNQNGGKYAQLPIPGYLIFTHDVANCGTTMIIPPQLFQDKEEEVYQTTVGE